MVYPHQLTIQLRKKQLVGLFPDPTFGFSVFYTGPNPMSLSQTPGLTDATWFDFTGFVDGLQDIQLTWSTTQTATGEVPTGQFRPKRGVSGTLTFERDAKDFLKGHLVDDVAASHNEIEARITDLATGSFENYVIKSADLAWCEYNSLCVFDINLKQSDPVVQCIERTMIADNWQGWFQNEPVDTTKTPSGGTAPPKYHPRFSYCTERRPNGVLILEWIGMAQLAIIVTIIYTVFYPILLTIYAIIGVINAIITAINTIPGISISLIPNPAPASPGSVISGWSTVMLEAAGCGREHPAPLIRDYISNVCDKCGVSYDAATIDIFFAPFLTITHSDGIQYTEPNPHYNACYLFPSVERGVRRFRNVNLLSGFTSQDTTTYYLPPNQPVLALSDFLDQLKKVYNARWEIKNLIDPVTHSPVPYLFFKRKDWWKDETALYDFSNGGADRHKIVEGICYQQSEFTVPASQNGLYEDDPSDKCGHEANRQYNGNPLSFNNTSIDPHFFGILDKNSGFGATKFNNDGASTSYLYDALQFCWSTIALSGGLTALIFSDLGDFMRDYADHAILLQLETVTKPKIVIWDGKSSTTPGNPYMNARAMRNDIIIAGVTHVLGYTASSGTYPGLIMPVPNPMYPVQATPPLSTLTTLAAPSTIPAAPPDNYWDHVNPPLTNVIGRIGGTGSPAGVYEVQDYLGTVRSSQAAILVNYPMYFTPYFKGSMFDLFHWIDSPYRNPQLHKTWKVKIPYCKEDAEKLGLLGDGTGVKLLSAVLLDTTYYNSGVITDITIDFGTNATSPGGGPGTGQTIELKGYV